MLEYKFTSKITWRPVMQFSILQRNKDNDTTKAKLYYRQTVNCGTDGEIMF